MRALPVLAALPLLLAPVPAAAQEPSPTGSTGATLTTATAGPTPTATAGPTDGPTPTPTATAGPSDGPTPTPSSTGGPDYCGQGGGATTTTMTPGVVLAGQPATYTVTLHGPLNRAGVSLGVEQVGPNAEGRTYLDAVQQQRGTFPLARGESVTYTATFRPTTNATGRWSGALYCGPGPFHGDVFGAGDTRVLVATRLTLGARRESPRRYVFSGTATRPGQLVSLYRVEPGGRQVLTAQTRATGSGTWRVRRTFLGSGRFGMVVRTGRDAANEPGASAVRPTVVH